VSKKRTLTPTEYEAYKRGHAYEDPLEAEEGKVRRERTDAARYRRKAEARRRRQLRDLSHPDDAEAWEDDPAADELERQARRELGNASAHKRRLHGLARYEEDLDDGGMPGGRADAER
jgi:hypothetical protein